MSPNQLDTPLKALHFAIDFAQADLERVALSEVQKQVIRFLCRPLLPALGDGLGQGFGLSPAPTRADLQRIQADVLTLLTGVVNPTVVFPLKLPTLGFLPVQPKGWKAIPPGTVLVSVGGSTRDRFLYRVIRLLEELGLENLSACPAPLAKTEKVCGRLFFRVTQKKFCSTRCQSRVNSRNYYDANLSAKSRKGPLHGKTTRQR